MVDINELKQKRAKLVMQSREILDRADNEGRSTTAEETEQYQKIDAEVDAITTRIAREERQLAQEAELARAASSNKSDNGNGNGGGVRFMDKRPLSAVPQEDLETRIGYALQGWLRAMKPDAKLEDEHHEAAKFFGINLQHREIVLPIAKDYRKVRKEFRDMSLTAASGGFTVPQGFVNSLEQALLQFGGVRQVADTIRTSGGADLPWPTMNDTANKGAILAEATTFSTSIDPVFASVILKSFKYSSKPIIVSNEILQDSAFDLSGMIGGWLGERIGRIQNDHFTTGAGTTLPKGLTVAGVVGKTAASMTTFTDIEVIDLQHSIDPAYRPNATWMMHDAVLAHIRKLKDVTSGQYLWQPGMQSGVPDRLLGSTYSINQSMSAAFTTGQKLLLYGDMSKYKIRDVREIRLVRLDELFAQTDQVGFVAFMRTDGNLLDAGTRPVKWLALL